MGWLIRKQLQVRCALELVYEVIRFTNTKCKVHPTRVFNFRGYFTMADEQLMYAAFRAPIFYERIILNDASRQDCEQYNNNT